MTARRSIPIAKPVLGDEEWHALREPLASGWLTQGPKVREFEQAFAERHEVGHALATTSCTTALHLALAALDIGPGDEVIVPAFSWVATANVVLYCGATPVFVDVRPDTYNIDIDQVRAAVTDRTRAVIPVHLFGLSADIDGLHDVLPDNISLVEDAACAAGASYHGRWAGGLGTAAAFSFHPRKSVTTGEGGMLTTNDPELAARAERLRNHGAGVPEETRHAGSAPYLLPEFDELGFNYRMPDLLAAVGVVQLGRLDDFVVERDRWARWYSERLADVPWLTPPLVPDGYGHAWQAYVTLVAPDAPQPRNETMRRLHDAGVATRPGTHAITELGYYRKRFNLLPGAFPVASMLEAQTMALPLHNAMEPDDFEYVVDTLLGS